MQIQDYKKVFIYSKNLVNFKIPNHQLVYLKYHQLTFIISKIIMGPRISYTLNYIILNGKVSDNIFIHILHL